MNEIWQGLAAGARLVATLDPDLVEIAARSLQVTLSAVVIAAALALGITRLNVYAGMAGFYFVRDEFDTGLPDNPLGLPAWPYEKAYAIQDRMFKDNGELFYPAFPGDPFYADFITGGRPEPGDQHHLRLEVDRRRGDLDEGDIYRIAEDLRDLALQEHIGSNMAPYLVLQNFDPANPMDPALKNTAPFTDEALARMQDAVDSILTGIQRC